MHEQREGEQGTHLHMSNRTRANARFAACRELLPRLRKAVGPILKFLEDVKDVIQEAMLAAWQICPAALWHEEASEQLRRWLFVVTRRLAIDRARHLQRHPLRSLDALPAEPRDRHDEDRADQQREEQECALLHDWMEELREKEPHAYRLAYSYYYQDRGIQELAEVERLTPHAVTNRLARIRAHFRARLLKLRDDANAP